MAESPLPDKCNHCGLRVVYDFRSADKSMTSDAAFGELNRLHAAGFVPKYRRRVNVSNVNFGGTEICAVASKHWLKPKEKCKHWVLRIEGASISDYLSIHQDRQSSRVSVQWAAFGVVVAVALFILGAVFGG